MFAAGLRSSDFDDAIRVLELLLESFKVVQRIVLDNAEDTGQGNIQLVIVAVVHSVIKKFEKLVQRGAAFGKSLAEIG